MAKTRKVKERIHREWFRTVSLGNRKSCPSCGTKLAEGEQIWSWGEYVRAKWRTVRHLCSKCWSDVKADLIPHANECGCQFELVGYGGQKLPEWMTLGEEVSCNVQQDTKSPS
jgi:hypothetical protein